MAVFPTGTAPAQQALPEPGQGLLAVSAEGVALFTDPAREGPRAPSGGQAGSDGWR